MLKRIIFFYRSAWVVYYSIYYSLVIIFSKTFNRKNFNFYKIYKAWSGHVLKSSHVRLEVIGKENLDKNSKYVFISNHSSLFDIPVIFQGLEHDIRIMYKKELEKIPIFGYSLKLTPFIPVARAEARNAMKSIDEAVENLKKDLSVILYPEGTRSRNGEMGPFKRGAFILAARSGKPIVPVAIIGSWEVNPAGTYYFSRDNVKVIIGKPVATPANPTKQEETELMKRVWNELHETLEANK